MAVHRYADDQLIRLRLSHQHHIANMHASTGKARADERESVHMIRKHYSQHPNTARQVDFVVNENVHKGYTQP